MSYKEKGFTDGKWWFLLLSGLITVGLLIRPGYATLATESVTIKGEATSYVTGHSVSKAGDVNGDGFADFIVGAPYASPNGANSGRAYVIFGSSTLTKGSEIDLSNITNGTGGFVINGESAGDMAGDMVAGGGDVNGDGFDDVVIGAPYNGTKGTHAGKAYVVFGKTTTTTIELSALTVDSNTSGFVIYGSGAYDFSGGSLSIADVNGDGLEDVIIGENYSAPVDSPTGPTVGTISFTNTKTDTGLAYIVFGKTTGTAVQLTDIASGIGGFVIQASGRKHYVSTGDYSGWREGAFITTGDVNGDGLADVLVGTGSLMSKQGYLIYGKSSTTAVDINNLSSSNGIILSHSARQTSTSDFSNLYGGLGSSPAIVGDVNGDGIADMAITIPNPSRFSESQQVVYVGFGSSSLASTINMNTNASSGNGFAIYNDVTTSGSYSSYMFFVKEVGDTNGDGLDDLLISDPYNAGRFYIVYGKTNTTNVNLSSVVSGNGGFVFTGNASNDYLGWEINGAGDVNGDGLADFIVGAPGVDISSATDAGSAYLQFGNGSSITQWGTANADTLTGTSGADFIAGGADNDTITGQGGADVLYGGAGDDTVVISDTNFVRIDGGTGTNTLRLEGANLTLNLSTTSQRVRNIQVFDITGSGNNTLSLTRTVGGKGKITVKGDSGDRVVSYNQNLTSAGTQTVDGVIYNKYTNGSITLLVQSGVALVDNQAPTMAAQSFTVSEGISGGTTIGTVVANDGDVGDSLTYTIMSGNEAGRFSVNASTGVLSVASSVKALDYEKASQYNLLVKVTDSVGETATATITINVTDVSNSSTSESLSLSKTGESIWGSNSSAAALIGDIGTLSGTTSYNLATLPQGNLVLLDYSLAGTLNVSSSFSVNGGTTDINVPMTLSISYPDEIQLGHQVKLSNSVALGSNAQFTASAPSFSYTGAATVTQFAFSVATDYSVLGSYASTLTSLGLPTMNYSGSSNSMSQSVTIASNATTATSSISSTSPIKLQASINAPSWISQTIPISWSDLASSIVMTKLLSGCKQDVIPPAYLLDDLYYKLYFNILDVKAKATAALTQDFTLDITPTATLTLENGDVIQFTAGNDLVFTLPTNADSNGDGIVTATLKVDVLATFSNQTDLSNTFSLPIKVGDFAARLQEASCTFTNGSLSKVTINNSTVVPPLVNVNESYTALNAEPSLTFSKVLSPVQFSLTGNSYTINLNFDLCDNGATCTTSSTTAPTASSVAISGTAKVGQVLTGSYTYSDVEGDVENGSTYRWYRADSVSGTSSAAISSATSQTYTVTTSDSSKYLRFCVTPKNAATLGTGTETCSSWTSVSNTAPTASTVRVSDTTPLFRQALMGSYTYTDVDGDSQSGSTYQWYRADTSAGANSTAISGATSALYAMVSSDDYGSMLRFCVTPKAATGITTGVETCSAWTSAVTNTAPVASNVTLSGTGKVGQTLTASYTWTDVDSSVENVYAHSDTDSIYQWYRASDTSGTGSTAISGATSQTYTLTSSDSDKAMRFCVTPSDGLSIGSEACSNWKNISPTITWYGDINYSGNSFNTGYALANNGQCINMSAYNMNDTVSSMKVTARNNYATSVIWYNDANCSGTVGDKNVSGGNSATVDSFATLGINDVLSSFRVIWNSEKSKSFNGACYNLGTTLLESEIAILSFQTDGNLVLYKRYPGDGNSWAAWATGTNGTNASKVCLQTDGNLVIYPSSGNAIWASSTHGKSVSTLKLQTDCNLVMYSNSGSAVWATGTSECYKNNPASTNALGSSGVGGL